jgi:N-acetylglucosamine malate deacetylase 1
MVYSLMQDDVTDIPASGHDTIHDNTTSQPYAAMNQTRVLVVAAHPDDEVLGCGGAIARHARRGDAVHILIVAEGVTSRFPVRRPDQHAEDIHNLRNAARQAAEILGAVSVTMLDFPDNRMDSVDVLDVTKAIEAVVAEHMPAIIYTHHPGDLNVDHERVHRAVAAACRPQPGCSVTRLLLFEVASGTGWRMSGAADAFTPNWFVDITSTLDAKLDALRAYGSEMRGWPHARSLEALAHQARWRGAATGVAAAEAFMLVHSLEK